MAFVLHLERTPKTLLCFDGSQDLTRGNELGTQACEDPIRGWERTSAI